MPAIGFNCDAGLIPFAECLDACPIGARCLSRPTLVEMSKVREWKGKPSTTQLLKGTREAFLDITCKYHIKPKEQAFRLLGTKHHARLEGSEGATELTEIAFDEDGMTGIADYYDAETKTLIDYKTLGSYKTGQIIGMCFNLVPDPTGELYKVGEKKGTPKMIKEWYIDPTQAENEEYELQLNRYRIFYENAGFPVENMQIQVTVRDGGTQVAESRGITELMYLVDVKRRPDEEVLGYFGNKAAMLELALKSGKCQMCSPSETWDGRKCESYCQVKQYCDMMGA